MRGRRLKKLFDAINLLAQPSGVTLDELAHRLNVGSRQAYRMLDTLQDDFCFVINRDQPMLGGEIRFSLEREQLKRLSDMVSYLGRDHMLKLSIVRNPCLKELLAHLGLDSGAWETYNRKH